MGKESRFPYAGDIPHTIKCRKCGRTFWTGHHVSTEGICNKCDPKWGMEIDPRVAKEVLSSYSKILWISDSNQEITGYSESK